MAIIHRAGYVAVIGRPNVGKSTLLNRLVGERLSIVSPKPQTTRHRVTGIVTRRDAQVVIVDTPGFHVPRHLLGRYMMRTVRAVLREVDVILVMIDATAGLTTVDRTIVAEVRRLGAPALLALNKIDRVPKLKLLPLMAVSADVLPWIAIVPISAVTGEHVESLLTAIVQQLPEGPPLFPPDQLSDQQTRFFIAEMIREQVLRHAEQEVPHAVAVLVDQMVDDESASCVRIHATLLVERQGQKAILIGHNGARLKTIGVDARRAIERWLQRHVYLQLWIKVRSDWRSDPHALSDIGYRG
jgi:GTP-binding protein Era